MSSLALAAAHPCSYCVLRSTCRSPCERLEPLLERPLGPGRLLPLFEHCIASPPIEADEDLPDDDPRVVPLRAAIALLSRDQRLVVEGRAEGVPLRTLARRLKRSTATVTRLNEQAFSTLRRLVAVPSSSLRSAHLSSSAPLEDPMASRTSARRLSPIPASLSSEVTLALAAPPSNEQAPPCAHSRCRHPVGAKAPTRPELAPYCSTHRRLMAIQHNRSERSLAASTDRGRLVPDEAALATLRRLIDERRALVHPITPALAAALLLRNKDNRAVADRLIETHAQDMRAGAWPVNNQGLGLGRDGSLYDGQHRLRAVIMAGVTVEMLVVGNLDEAARMTIDLGRARRTGDVLRMFAGEKHGPRIVSWARALEMLHAGKDVAVSAHAAQGMIERYRGSIDWMLAHGLTRQPYGRASVIAALLYAHHVLGEAIEPFLVGYASGVGLSAGSPALLLRSYACSGLQGSGDRNRKPGLKTLRCVLAFLRNETLERIQPTTEGYDHLAHLEAERESTHLLPTT